MGAGGGYWGLEGRKWGFGEGGWILVILFWVDLGLFGGFLPVAFLCCVFVTC